jgi:diguanylate cyclase (GGDEF)-like protein
MPDNTPHESFSKIITQLDRDVKRGWRGTLVGTAMLLLVGIYCAPALKFSTNTSANMRLGGILFFLTLASSIYGLLQFHELKKVRDRLNEQLQHSIKQRKRAEKLYGLSILDPLTGLHNRRFGEERLGEEIERAEKSSDPLALIIFDLDHFKEINDQFGHAAGDAALKEFSRQLKKAVRACDVPVRIGGDEFLVILPDCPRDRVNAILSRLGAPEVWVDATKIPIKYSVGRSQYQFTDTIETMLKRADEVLYSQKRARPSGSGSFSKMPAPEPLARYN